MACVSNQPIIWGKFGSKIEQPKKNHTAEMQPGTFRTGEFYWSKGTLINISSKTHKRKAPEGKISKVFLPDTFKTAFQMRNE